MVRFQREIKRGFDKADQLLGQIQTIPVSHGGTTRQVSEPTMVDTKMRLFSEIIIIETDWVRRTNVEIDWYAKSQREPTGIPRYTRDYESHLPPDERLRTTIPRYSTDKEAFGQLERRLGAYNIAELYLQLLVEEGLDETTATLEQKCVAILKARNQKR